MSYNYKRPLNNSYKALPYSKTATTEVSIYDETFPNKFNFPYQKQFKPHYNPKYAKHLYHHNYPYHGNTYKSSLATALFPHSSPFHPHVPFAQEQTATNPSQVLLNKYEGLCNYIIFSKESSLYLGKASVNRINELSLKSFFSNFDYSSSFSSDISFMTLHNEIVSVNYTVTLSSMLLCVTLPSHEALEGVLSKIKAQRFAEKAHMYFHIDDALQVRFDLDKTSLTIEYYETKLHHQRKVISEQINDILTVLDISDSALIKHVDKESWFCLKWTPIHASRKEFGATSFLVYYQLGSCSDTTICNKGYNQYYEIPIIGILPIKFSEELWLRKIKKVDFGSLYYHREFMDFKMAVNNSIINVHEFIFRENKRTSVDYELYAKSCSLKEEG